MVWSDDGQLGVADSDKTEGGAGCGNRIGGWRLDQGATEWTEVFDRQAGVVHGLAAAGSLVIVTGRGWCTAADWGWTLVSTDGGRTWDPDLSWTGAQFTCVADVAIAAGVAVMLGCPEDGHPIWRSVLPEVPVEPTDLRSRHPWADITVLSRTNPGAGKRDRGDQRPRAGHPLSVNDRDCRPPGTRTDVPAPPFVPERITRPR